MTGRDTFKERHTKPIKIGESDIDVSIRFLLSDPCKISFCFIDLTLCAYIFLFLGKAECLL